METNSATAFAEKTHLSKILLFSVHGACVIRKGKKKEIKVSLEEGIMKESPYWGIGHAEREERRREDNTYMS